MADLDTLNTIKSNLLSQISALTASPKPNYSIDGQSVSWQSLYDSLWAKLKEVNDQINALDPYEERSQGFT